MVFFVVFAMAVLLAVLICWMLMRQTPEEKHWIQEAKEAPVAKKIEPVTTWHSDLDRFPGVLGWMVLRRDGAVIDSSTGTSKKDLGPLLHGVLDQILKFTETATGSSSPNYLSWEGENESLLIVPPRNPHTGMFLVLFLGREQYQSEIRNLLLHVNWEQKQTGSSLNAAANSKGS